MRKTATFFLVAVVSITRADEKIDTAKAVEQAKAMAEATVAGDYGKLADSTHPRVIELAGGREKMIELAKSQLDLVKKKGLSIESFTVGKAADPVVDGKSAYVVIATKMVMKSTGSKIEAESYLLGVSTDTGKAWTFVDAAGLVNAKARKQIFPSLPEGLKLPERKQPKVTPIKD